MFVKRFVAIIAVHNDEVLWIDGRQPDAGRCLLRLPLEQVLGNATVVADRIPRMLKGNHRTLWIVPDHWFGMERYAFQSTRPALIEPFLERKLAAVFPERRQVRHFFNYRSLSGAGEAGGLMAYFLQDEKGYQLYDTLLKIDQAPRHIAAPGFLWANKLPHVCEDFEREGTLLIHMGARECMLYFYFRGNFIFSRNVVLSEQDRMEALSFEINQSLYMFSQKTKNELNRLYLLAHPSESPDLFGQALGREVIDLGQLLKKGPSIAIPEAPFIDSVLGRDDLAYKVPFFSLTHRQVKRELEWAPVQWAGILIGALLLIPLIGQSLLLGRMLHREMAAQGAIEHQTLSAEADMSEYENALDRVLEAVEQPMGDDALRRLLHRLPEGIRVREIMVDLDHPPAVQFSAAVQAEDADHLKVLLNRLVERLKADFVLTRNFSLNNIDVVVDPNSGAEMPPQYLIAVRLELT
jgi:hypothetical protein